MYRYYKSLDEFVDELFALFDNWVQYHGINNKMYTHCDQMRKRFEKFIDKHRVKHMSSDW